MFLNSLIVIHRYEFWFNNKEKKTTHKERYSKEQRKRNISDNYELHEF